MTVDGITNWLSSKSGILRVILLTCIMGVVVGTLVRIGIDGVTDQYIINLAIHSTNLYVITVTYLESRDSNRRRRLVLEKSVLDQCYLMAGILIAAQDETT